MKAAAAIAPAPAIGQPWPDQGGIYAGICRGRDGQADHHLILAPDKPEKRLAWKAAGAWAKKVRTDGHKDFSLPDRWESAVLFGNLREEHELAWHWTSTQFSATLAWGQGFYYGCQNTTDKSYEGLVRAVRRLPINPSVLPTKDKAAAP